MDANARESNPGETFAFIRVHSRLIKSRGDRNLLMNAKEHELILKDEVYEIVGAAMEVSNHLGCGFLEAVYQEALGVEFAARHIVYQAQKRIEISYKGAVLRKEYIADFLCMDSIIVEIKAIKAISGIEEAQLLNYLKASSLRLGLIINFGSKKLEWRRYANAKSND